MDTFFDRGFVALHQEVIDHLVASYGIHSLLPGVLGLNRHFRALAIKALLKPFSKTKVKGQKGIKIRDPWFQYTAGGIGEGEYLKVSITGYCPQEGAHEADDPRYYLKKPRPSIYLLLKSFDPKMGICTFVPPGRYKSITYHLHCDKNGREFDDVPCSFDIVSSGWFRQSKGPTTLYGLALAAREDRYPVCCPALWPDPSKEQNGKYEAADEKVGGWTISYETIRDHRPGHSRDRAGIMKDVEAKLVVKHLKIPLIDLYAPRETQAEKGYYENNYGGGEEQLDRLHRSSL